MASFRRGTVSHAEERDGLFHARVTTPEGEVAAVGFPHLVERVSPGDEVVVNTTGIDLSLGTGGVGFIVWNLHAEPQRDPGDGHIVKLRYTPAQSNVVAAEAPESPHHSTLRDVRSIDGMPVVCGGLHSQVAGIAAGIKAAAPDARVGYLMTDGAALPLAWSRLIRSLKDADLVDATCTCGHAFGGDLEAVNVFSGLAALRHAALVDVAIVALGPGVVGTGSALGYSAIEQGPNLDAAAALGGHGIACLRISFADERERHRGVSHHSLTALSLAAREPASVVVPKLAPSEARVVARQLRESGACDRHRMVTTRGDAALHLLRERKVSVSTMGRSMDDEPHLFLAAGAAGRVAGEAWSAGR